jgi:nucleoside-diphosphate-sugar epimerase
MSGVALITGISGFTGHYMAQELGSQGYEVHGLGRGEPGDQDENWHAVDLRDQSVLSRLILAIKPDVVVHLAAIAFVGHSDASDIYTSNIVGTQNLLRALVDSGSTPEKVLLASSANIYGHASSGLLTENCPASPENDYAVSKYAMELMSRHWLKDLPIVTARPFNYTGVGQSPSFLIPKIVGHFARGETAIELGNVDVYRDYSDVRMVVDAYGSLLHKGQPGEAYNICSGQIYSIADILFALSQLAGYEIEVRVNSKFVRENEVKRLAGSSQHLLATIGERDSIPFKDTLAWMYEAAAAR